MAWGWYVLLGFAALLFLLLLSRASVCCAWEDGVALWVGVGPVRLQILPHKECKPKKPRKAPEEEHPPSEAPPPEEERKKPELGKLLELAKLGVRALGWVLRCLRVDEWRLHAVVGSGDAAQTALMYGGASAALSELYGAVAARTKIRRQDISLDVDFSGKRHLDFQIRISGMILCLLIVGIRVLICFLKIRKQRKRKADGHGKQQ